MNFVPIKLHTYIYCSVTGIDTKNMTNTSDVDLLLYPIRIDVSYPTAAQSSSQVSASTKSSAASGPPAPVMSIRIIDTLLVDPKSLIRMDQRSQMQLFYQWAHSIVTDAMVVGITRNHNHTSTTNRTKETTTTTTTVEATSTTGASTTSSSTSEFKGRYSIEVVSSSSSSAAVDAVQQSANYVPGQLIQLILLQIQSQCRTMAQYQQLRMQYDDDVTNRPSSTSCSDLVPIRLRMELPNHVRLHDDFVWDMRNSHTVTPIQVAQSMVTDLQLSEDTVPIICAHIMEQIIRHVGSHGISTVHNNHVDGDDANIHTDEGMMMGPIHELLLPPSTHPQPITAAWEISPTIHTSNVSHLERILSQPS
jgi:SNF5 / SMARCB1 / INI1